MVFMVNSNPVDDATNLLESEGKLNKPVTGDFYRQTPSRHAGQTEFSHKCLASVGAK